MFVIPTCLNMILLRGKVIETLITAAPQPHMNSLKSLLLSRSTDFNVTFGDVMLLILILFLYICI